MTRPSMHPRIPAVPKTPHATPKLPGPGTLGREQIVSRFARRVRPEICYCYNCQPYDGGEAVWVLGDRTDLEDVFDSYEVPEDIRDEVASELKCRNCGTEMARWDDVGLQDSLSREFDRKTKIWRRKYGKRLIEFERYLARYPYLGAAHSLGRLILKSIKSFPLVEDVGKDWYRARKVDSPHVMCRTEMTLPNPRKHGIPEGRFNHYGQAHLYLADSEQGAAREVLATGAGLAWVQHLRIRKAAKVLDMRRYANEDDPDLDIVALGLIFSGIIHNRVSRRQHWRPGYFVPRFIADAAKSAGFTGIVYDSNRHHGSNLVLFQPERVIITAVGRPMVYELHRPRA